MTPKERVLYYAFLHRERLLPLWVILGEVDDDNQIPSKFSKGTIVSQFENRVQCLVHIKEHLVPVTFTVILKAHFTLDRYV
jgi:hypothetical protein